MDKLAETVGFALVIGFLWFVWPPLVLLGAGLLLLTYANTRQHSGRLSSAVAAALGAGRRAYEASRQPADEPASGELRRVA